MERGAEHHHAALACDFVVLVESDEKSERLNTPGGSW
jgi:hypothetical protein